jgi:hypothetical protein
MDFILEADLPRCICISTEQEIPDFVKWHSRAPEYFLNRVFAFCFSGMPRPFSWRWCGVCLKDSVFLLGGWMRIPQFEEADAQTCR